jgi:carboxyl-terminal processing protease
MKVCAAALLMAGGVACAAASQTPAGEMPAPLASAVAVSTFDSVWNVVRNTYVDTAFVARRWVEVRDTLRPRAQLVSTRKGLSSLLSTALARIPDSHFYIIPEGAGSDDTSSRGEAGGTTGIDVRAANGNGIIWRVEPGSPAAKNGITAGETVDMIGNRNVSLALRKVGELPEPARQRALSEMLYSFNHAVSPAAGTEVRVRVRRSGAKRSVEKVLVAVPAAGTISQFGNLPPLAGRVVAQRLSEPGAAGTGRCVGVIAFNIWLPALVPELERAVDRVGDCVGIVLDLRGNPGGAGAMVMGFGGYFVDSALSLGTMRSRQLALRFAMNPRRVKNDGSAAAPFHGPLAILVDPMTASTSEIFATGMQRIGRARVFGERSAGAALPAMMDRLPSGDVFVHAVADFVDPDGRRIEGSGVVPDEIVPLSAKELAAGRDTALEAATRWIRTSSAARRSSPN